MYYLYLKTHNTTGLKYLGYTKSDPYRYQGSGKYWINHINKHGYDVTTEILFETANKEEIKEHGLHYSNKFNIVESKEFANLKVEQGDGGWGHIDNSLYKKGNNYWKGKSHTKETKDRLSVINTGKVLSNETKQKISIKSKLMWKRKTPEDLMRFRIKQSKRICSDVTKEKIRISKLGDKNPAKRLEVRKKIAESVKNAPKIKCIYCDIITNIGNHNRWHGNNCKLKELV